MFWILFSVFFFRAETAQLSDNRIRIMNEILSAMRVIKMYAWEIPFQEMVNQARRYLSIVLEGCNLFWAPHLTLDHLWCLGQALYLEKPSKFVTGSADWMADYCKMSQRSFDSAKCCVITSFFFFSIFSRNEVKVIRKVSYCRALNMSIFFTSNKIILLLIFLTYILSGKVFTAEVVFVTVALMNNVRVIMTLFFPYAIALFSEMRISISRIQARETNVTIC